MGIFNDVVSWFVDDVLGIDQGQDNQYGNDISIYSTEAYLPVFKGTVKDVSPTVVAFIGVSGDNTGDDVENDLLHKVFVFGKGVASIDAVRIDGIDSESDDWKDEDGAKWIYVRKFPNGMHNYNYELLEQAGFKSSYDFTDCCCVYVRAEAGSEVITSEPTDVRIDVTGKSPLALHSNTTEEQRKHNPVSHLYEFLTTNESGPKWPASKLNTASWTKAEDDCNIQIETYAGSLEYQARYTFDSAIDTSQNTHEIITNFLQNIRAHMPFDNSLGQYLLILEQDDNYASIEISDTDIEGGINTTESADVGNKVNQVIVKYPDLEQNGKSTEVIYPSEGSTTDLQWLSEDNQQRKSKTITLNSCNNYYRAMQQAKIEAENSRHGLTAELLVKPRAYSLKTGEILKVTSTAHGWNLKPFRIISKVLHSDLFSSLTLREHQPYIFDYHNTGEKPLIPDTTINPNILASPTSLSIINSDLGGLKATWVSSYSKFQWQLQLVDGTFVNNGTENNLSAEIDNLVINNSYLFSVRAINNIGRVSQWVKSPVFTYTLVSALQKSPTDPLSPVVEAPSITPNTTDELYVWKIYYDTTNHGETPDQNQAIYGGLLNYINGQTFTITNALPSTTYYVWFGVVKRSHSNEFPTNWTKRSITSGSGISVENFNPTLANEFNTLLQFLDENDGVINNTWHSGTNNPSNSLGTIGDFYLKSGRYVYEKTASSTWTYKQDLKGATGQNGTNGQDGLSAYEIWLTQGNSGTETDFINDLNATDGVDGNTWHSGTNNPSNSLGTIGDFYLKSGRYVYEKTAASTWTYKQDLKGATGQNGTNGTNGTNGQDGERGSRKFYGQITVGSVWTDSLANSIISSAGFTKVRFDEVTLYKDSIGYAQSKYWSGSTWVSIDSVLDGNLLVRQTVRSEALDTNAVRAEHLSINSTGNESGNSSGVGMVFDPFSSTPINITNKSTNESIFNIQIVDGKPLAAVNGYAGEEFIRDAKSITEDVKRSINQYYLGNGASWVAAAANMSSGSHVSTTAVNSESALREISFNLSKSYDTDSDENFTNPKWRVLIRRGGSTGSIIFDKTYTGNAYNYSQTYDDDEYSGYSISINDGFVDTSAPSNASYTLQVYRDSSDTNSSTTIRRNSFTVSAPAFKENDIDTSATGGYSFTDKETGFTVKGGRSYVSGNNSTSVTFTDAFSTYWTATCIGTSSNVGQGATGSVSLLTNSKITITNHDGGQSGYINWIAIGYTAV